MLPPADNAHALDGLSQEARARHDVVTTRAIEIFGCRVSAYIWLHRYGTSIAAGAKTPMHIAIGSDEGVTLVLSELELIAPTITVARRLCF